MRGPLATAVALAIAAGCGDRDRAPETTLQLEFPDAQQGVVPYLPGGPLWVEVQATIPGLRSSTRADVSTLALVQARPRCRPPARWCR